CFEVMQNEKDVDVVYGYQEKRKGRFIESLGGRFFYWSINKISEVKIPENILSERLMRKQYVESLNSLGDANLFMGGMMYWTGYNQIGLPVAEGLRGGESTYSTRKRLELMLQAVTSFSGKPLEYLFYSGLLITVGSILSIIYLIAKKIIWGDE